MDGQLRVRLAGNCAKAWAAAIALSLLVVPASRGSVGDPQVKTDHPWYPGELSCSTWERLFRTQAEVYRRVTGRSGWWLLIGLLPIIGAIVLLFMVLQDSHPGENQYGPNPKTVPPA